MAPEQVTSAHEVDGRADVCGLGCCAYHLLVGRPPFPGEDVVAKLNQHQRQEPTRLVELRPEVPPELAALVSKMMAKKPEARYQTLREVAETLDTVLARLDGPLLGLDWKLPAREAKKSVQKPLQAPESSEVSLATTLLAVVLFLGVLVLFGLLLLR